MSLAKPNKHLAYSEDHFEGYWARLTALIRHNDEADYILDELLTSPLLSLTILDDDNNLRAALTALYTERGLTYPTKKTIEEDPLTSIRNFLISTQSSEDEAIAAWKALNLDDLKRYRKGIKYIYEIAVATLSVAEATEFLGDLPYGSGIKLLQRIKEKQRRQTSMSLFVLFDNVLSLKLKTGEKLSTLFSRMMALRQRLSNWTPPIMLPDQLVLVCILRALPTKYQSTRTIIMATQDILLDTAKHMLLDAENADARLIQATLGSNANSYEDTGTALAANAHNEKKNRDENPSERQKNTISKDHVTITQTQDMH